MNILAQVTDYFKSKDIYYDENVVLKISKIIEKSPNISQKDFERKISSIKTDFFRLNKLNRKKVSSDIIELKDKESDERKKLGISEEVVVIGKNLIEKIDHDRDIFFDVKKIVERFLEFFEQRIPSVRNERQIQDLLDSYLNAALGKKVFTVKELRSGDGFLDIMLICSKNDDINKILFELKIFYGPAYYKKGIDRLKEYMDVERLEKSFYIVCDPRKSAKTFENIEKVENKDIFVYFVKKKKN